MTDITMDVDTKALRQRILTLAIQGKLTDQRKEDGTAQDLYNQIQEEKQKLIKEKKIKKEKPLSEITEEEKNFDIPENWMWVRLGNLGAPIQYPFADGPFGSNLKKEHYTTNREVRIIQLSNIGENGWRDENVKYTTFAHLKLISRSEVSPGDIVIAKMMPAGRAIIVPNKDPKYVLSSDAVKFVPNKHLYLPFVINCINSPVFQNQVTANVQGTTRKRTSLSKLKNCLLPLPPLAEQKRIADKISALFAKLDAIDKAYGEYRELQQTMKSRLLEQAIQGKLTDQRKEDGNAQDLYNQIQEEKQRLIKEKKIKKEKPLPEITEEEKNFDIPENWMWVRLGNLGAPIQYPFADGPFGSNLKKEHYTTNREVRIIQLSNIGENGWRDENVKYTTFAHLKLISRSEVSPGDIVIAKMMPAGRAIIVPNKDPKYVLSSDAVKFVPNKHLYLPFVINCINSPVFQNQVTANVQGTTRKRTSLSKLKNCLLPLPPLAEQKRIVEKLDKLLPLCEA